MLSDEFSVGFSLLHLGLNKIEKAANSSKYSYELFHLLWKTQACVDALENSVCKEEEK